MAEAMFGAGCFWGVEEAFRRQEGVTSTAVGYSGGATENPTYEQVCTGRTGHVEVVHVQYDPEQLSYEQILDLFWNCHDPTTLNRQGPDVGSQYRSAILYYSPEQEVAANTSLQKLEQTGRFNRPIVTEIPAAGEFLRADVYH